MSQEQEMWQIEKSISGLNSLEDLRHIKSVVMDKITLVAKSNARKLKPGMKVKISGSNRLEKGTIIKVNRTRAVVDVDGIQWTVPFSMLTEETKNG